MSRRVVGEKPVHVATSASFFLDPEPRTHHLVEVVCNQCGKTARTFDRRMPEGWTERYAPLGMVDLCSPECLSAYDESWKGVAWA